MNSHLTQTDRLQCSEIIQQRLEQNWQTIAKCLAVAELRLFLVQKGLFTALEAEQISSAATLLTKVGEKALQVGPIAYTVLYECINQLDHHLGHRYIKALLDGRKYATEEETKQSDAIKQNVVDRLSEFVNCNIPKLVTVMVSRELLTCGEGEQLTTAQVDKYTLILRLVNLLDTKGPLAYRLFADCLHCETEHVTHRELYDLVIQPPTSRKRERGLDICCIPSTLPLPKQKLHGCLQGRKYDAVMRMFQSCHHNGKWAELEDEAAKLFSGNVLEMRVVGLLESAVSWIFRKEATVVIRLVGEAKKLLKKVNGDNNILLDGRSEYILSRLYRYLKDYDKAQQHVEKAMYLLRYAEPGEDSAFVHYCDACIKVERLSEHATVQEVKDAELCYHYAIDHAHRHDSGLDLVAPHSFMRLAQMYLGSSHYTSGSKRDLKSIQKASDCLSQVNATRLAQRSQCHFHLIQSDLCRCQDKMKTAFMSVCLALDIAQKYNFTLEVGSAKDRLDSLAFQSG